MPNKKIQFLRNSTIYTPSNGQTAKDVAKSAIEESIVSLLPSDGEFICARYQETNEDVKTLLCVYHNVGARTGWTFFDDTGGNIFVPTRTSDLTNDSGFLTSHQDLSTYVNNATYDSTNKKIILKHDNTTLVEVDCINTLDSSAVISSVSNGVVTLKAGLIETDGMISNTTSSDITLSRIATTASPSDMNVTYNNTVQDLQTVLNVIKSEINSAASSSTEYIVCQNVASEIPSGFTYYNGNSGTLTATATTTGKVYLIKNSASSYEQVITTQNNNTYSWTSLGSTTVDLSGVVRTITVNGASYNAGNGNTVNLGELITSVIGQTTIANANTDFVHITASTSSASNGNKTVTLTAETNVVSVSSGNNGLANASDIKNYVDNRVVFKNWYNNDIQS